jgi:hypothetical protein
MKAHLSCVARVKATFEALVEAKDKDIHYLKAELSSVRDELAQLKLRVLRQEGFGGEEEKKGEIIQGGGGAAQRSDDDGLFYLRAHFGRGPVKVEDT